MKIKWLLPFCSRFSFVINVALTFPTRKTSAFFNRSHEETQKPTASPANKLTHKDALQTAKRLFFEEGNERTARIQPLEAENAQLRSEADQLHDRCERYRDTLIALIR